MGCDVMRTINDCVLDLLGAALARVPTEARFSLNALSPPLTSLQLKQVRSRGGSLYKAVNGLVEPDDVECAYALVAALVDEDHPAGRIFLDDLAEMLALPPLIYRTLRAAKVDNHRRSAA